MEASANPEATASAPGPLTANQGYASNDDNLPVAHYVDLQRQVIFEAARLLAPGGAIFYNHSPRNQNSGQWRTWGDDHSEQQTAAGVRAAARDRLDEPGGHNMKKGAFVRSYEEIFVLPGAASGRAQRPGDNGRVGPGTRPREPRRPVIPGGAAEAGDALHAGGSVVLDPYMGSGTTAVAAVLEGWTYVGIELDAEMIEAANNRILRAPRCAGQR